MSTGNKRWIAAGGAALAVLATILLLRSNRTPQADKNRSADEGANTPLTRRDYPGNAAGDRDAGGATRDGPVATAPDPLAAEKQVEELMGTWRNAILNKDADTVIAIDGAFANQPKKYQAVLMKSAETDENERVRAFSTRVLGKRVDPECAPLFIRLLADKSPYVRMNAAWGLGELANTPAGRPVAKPALRALHRIEKQDSSPDTRTAASLAAKRLM
jgi:hypothetical protein